MDEFALWIVVGLVLCVVAIVARWNAKSRAADTGATKIDSRNIGRRGWM